MTRKQLIFIIPVLLFVVLVGFLAVFGSVRQARRHRRNGEVAIAVPAGRGDIRFRTIGIVYVVFSAAMILVLSQVAHGGEEISNLLVGAILWVSWPEALRTAALYGALGLLLGSVGVGIVVMRNALERRGELAAIRAERISSRCR